MAWLRVSASHGLYAITGMRAQDFHIPLFEVVDDIAVVNLVDMVRRYCAGALSPVPLSRVDAAIKRLEKGRRLGQVSQYSGGGNLRGTFG